MFYALVHYPEIDTNRINQLREKYDPQYDLIEPHITIVFPVPGSVGEQSLAAHIDGVLRGWRPFPIRLRGLLQSPDNYLLLLVEDGSASISRLQTDFYRGMLACHLRKEIPFVPHVTLGVFDEDPERSARVLLDTERMGLDYECSVDRFHLVTINDDRSRILQSREFPLRA